MADKPSRALVVFGDGLARGVGSQSCAHHHLHSLVSLSSCGFLSLPDAPSSESEDERIAREFALLLDASDVITTGKDSAIQTLSDRFMGMKAAVVTSNSGLEALCGKLGLSVHRPEQFVGKDFDSSEASVVSAVSELVKLLGFQDGRVLETSPFDLVFVHIGAGETGKGVVADVEHVNNLVGGIMRVAPPGSEIGSRLHLSVVMSYGNVKEGDRDGFSIENLKDEMNPFHVLFPRQSYTMRGEKPRDNVRHYCPMLIAQWQYAVTRVDMAQDFSFTDFKLRGGNLVIPVDRFLHEVAFKLWKAPKYGA